MSILILTSLLLLAYLASLAIHRLYFNPLAHFPGPKLAALSRWYEIYYDVFNKGSFIWKIEELHAQYGPIVRITPFELHIKDSTFWDTLYVRYPKANKYHWLSGRFGNDRSTFTTADARIHAKRRAPLNNLFSRRAILNLEDVVQDKLDILCHRIEDYHSTGAVCNLVDAFAAFSGDVISQYSFGFSYDHLDSEGFKENLHAPFLAVTEFGYVMLHFSWVKTILDLLPEKKVEEMNPPLKKIFQLQKDFRSTIHTINSEREKGTSHPIRPTLFHTLLDSDLPPHEKSTDRLGEEAQTVIAAGLTTTSWALCNAAYYLLSNSKLLTPLLTELDSAIPNPSAPDAFHYPALEKLPYLGACAREAIRMSVGVPSRNPRLISEPIVYGEWTIPPDTPVSMTATDVLFDEKIFPDARSFVPERWLRDDGAPRAPDGKPLDHYFVAFGKGPRSCLGINLAYMELYKCLAAMFRRFSFELHETDESDVLLAHDFFLPSPKIDSKGVRVTVTEVRK